jgi:hypothetical protein
MSILLVCYGVSEANISYSPCLVLVPSLLQYDLTSQTAVMLVCRCGLHLMTSSGSTETAEVRSGCSGHYGCLVVERFVCVLRFSQVYTIV